MENKVKVTSNLNYKLAGIKETITEISKESLERVGEHLVSFMKKYIWDEWYANFQPSYYDRTYQYIDSLTYKLISTPRNNSYRILIYWEMPQIKAVSGGVNWGQHKGFSDRDFRWEIIEWIDQGSSIYLGGVDENPRKYQTGIHVVDAAKKEHDKIVDTEIRDKLRITIRDKKPKNIK